MSQDEKKESGEKKLVDLVCEGAVKVVERHGLDKENFLAIKEVQFPHGRADLVIYGLCNGLYVFPLGVEVKESIKSGTDLFYHITQIRESYEYAFTHIYLAASEVRKEEIIKKYLEEVGYGLLKITGNDVEVKVEARPKKIYRSEHDYCEVASKGLLMMVTKQVLMNAGFRVEDLKVSSLWTGLKPPLSYCAFLRGNYAVFGVYALKLENVKELLKFLMNEKSLLENLGGIGYRIYLEFYPAVRKVIGYIHLFDEPLSVETVKRINDAISKGVKAALVKGWGVGLGVYKRLWEFEFIPTYPTALKSVENALTELKDFRALIRI